jgi:hypothetical protein
LAAALDEDVRRIDVDVEMECRGRPPLGHRHAQCDLRGVEGPMALAVEGVFRQPIWLRIWFIAETAFAGEQTMLTPDPVLVSYFMSRDVATNLW